MTTSTPPPAEKPVRKPRSRPPTALVRPATAAAAYQSALPRALALSPEQVAPPEIDTLSVVAQTLAALPALRELRATVGDALPPSALRCFDDLEPLALAAWFAHMRDELDAGADDAAQLTARATVLREELLVAAEALARKELLDVARVRAVREGGAPDEVAPELLALSDLFLWNWGSVHNRTAVTQEEVAEAGELAQKLIVARSRAGEAAAPAGVTDFRARTLTLFARAHDACVRVVTYLRWNDGDAARVLPPIAVRRARAKSTRATGEGEVEARSEGVTMASTPALRSDAPVATSVPAAPSEPAAAERTPLASSEPAAASHASAAGEPAAAE